MADGGNSDVDVVPEFRLDVSGPETCTKKESMRVFFKQAQEPAQESAQENKFTPSEEEQDPVLIKSSGNFEVPFDTRNEIRCLPRTKSARLKLHRQIEFRSDTALCISIKVETVPGCNEDVSFDLDYFELACSSVCSEDHVLWGEGKPDQFIRIGAEYSGCESVPIAIEASDVSATGELAVTVYFNPIISDTHIPERNTRYNFGARFARASDRTETPDGDRVSKRASATGRGSIYTPHHGSAHTPEQGSTHNPAQVPTHGVQHTASLGPPQDSRTPTLSQAHSHASDHVHILDPGHSHAPSTVANASANY
ncbi:hypothetical protein BGZ67_008799 [Mortierella alpina]|nr:hypothetical protein BGZ67_008799 [Mortierella alpina]